MLILLSLLASYVPIAILYNYLRNLCNEANYKSNCKDLLIKGILCCLGVSVLDLFLTILMNLLGIKNTHPLIREAIKAFVIYAFAEELVKYLTGNSKVKENINNISWIDCIAYFTIVGIGFQIIETIVYLVESNAGQTIVRGLLMGHPTYGLIMGYFIGKGLYTRNNKYKIHALIWPILLHGLYDFSLAEELLKLNDNFVFLPFITLIIGFICFIRILLLIRKQRNNIEYNKSL